MQPLHCSRKTDKGGNSIRLNGVWHSKHGQQNTAITSLRSLRSTMQRFGYESSAVATATTVYHSALNLHHVWDDTFLETAMIETGFNGSRNALELDLMNDIWSHRWDWDQTDCANGQEHDCVEAWANEALSLALQYAYANEQGQPIHNGSILSRDYYESRLPIVRLQLARAGYRLAITLDHIFLGG
jgi:S1/P1 Nuclease